MKIYARCLAAYLTGWVIAQTFLNRLWKWAMREQRGKDWEEFHQKIAVSVAEELERLQTGEGYNVNGPGVDMIAERIMGELVLTGTEVGLVYDDLREQMPAACRRAFQSVLEDRPEPVR